MSGTADLPLRLLLRSIPGYAASMEKQRLLATLRRAPAELSQAEEASIRRRWLSFDQLTDDLQQKCESDEEATVDAQVEPASSGLKDLLLKFEADHPQLSVVGRPRRRCAGGDGDLS